MNPTSDHTTRPSWLKRGKTCSRGQPPCSHSMKATVDGIRQPWILQASKYEQPTPGRACFQTLVQFESGSTRMGLQPFLQTIISKARQMCIRFYNFTLLWSTYDLRSSQENITTCTEAQHVEENHSQPWHREDWQHPASIVMRFQTSLFDQCCLNHIAHSGKAKQHELLVA